MEKTMVWHKIKRILLLFFVALNLIIQYNGGNFNINTLNIIIDIYLVLLFVSYRNIDKLSFILTMILDGILCLFMTIYLFSNINIQYLSYESFIIDFVVITALILDLVYYIKRVNIFWNKAVSKNNTNMDNEENTKKQSELNDEDSVYCYMCGTKYLKSEKHCPFCYSENEHYVYKEKEQYVYCYKCGEKYSIHLKNCPKCNSENTNYKEPKKPKKELSVDEMLKKTLIIVLILLVIAIIIKLVIKIFIK